MKAAPLPVHDGPVHDGPVVGRPAVIMSGIATVGVLVAAALWATTGLRGVSGGEAGALRVQPPTVVWVSDPEGISQDAAARAAVTLSGDGLFRVGADLPPGIYRSAGPRSVLACQWERLVTPPLGQSAVRETASGQEQQVITVEPSDTALFSVGCLPWTRIG